MSWDDIDFDFIATGMITRGPAEISWAAYLNVFRDALDEKYNLLTRGGEGTVFNDIPEFYVGNIRLAGDTGPDNNNEYFEGIIAYWGYLRDLWNNNAWYTSEVMTTPFDAEQYRIETADLKALIGDQAFEVFNNGASSNVELHTAECFNAWYTLLSLMQYRGLNSEAAGFTLFGPKPKPQTCYMNIGYDGTDYNTQSIPNEFSPSGECLNLSNAANTAGYNSFLGDNSIAAATFPGGAAGRNIAKSFQVDAKVFPDSGGYAFDTNYLQQGGYEEFTWFQTRAKVNMAMDSIKGDGAVTSNYSFDPFEPLPKTNTGVFTSDFAQVTGIGDKIAVDITSYLKETDHGQATGSRYRYSFYDWNVHMPKYTEFTPIKGVVCATDLNAAIRQSNLNIFSMSISSLTYVDMNNSALDFFIAAP